jgi:DNA-binding transcriptional ArsR family regulator
LVKALSHPLRVEVLNILSERIASPKEISDQLDKSLTNVSYHIRVLEEFGLIEIVEEESVRGSVAHFYKTVEQHVNANPDWEKLDPRLRGAVSAVVFENGQS